MSASVASMSVWPILSYEYLLHVRTSYHLWPEPAKRHGSTSTTNWHPLDDLGRYVHMSEFLRYATSALPARSAGHVVHDGNRGDRPDIYHRLRNSPT